MNLLTVSENNGLKENFDPYFEKVDYHPLSEIRLNLLKDKEAVFAGEEPAKEYDSLFIKVKPELSIFVRVLLEGLEKEMSTNLDSTSSYILTKKQYLYKVLNERGISIPKTVTAGSEKSASGISDMEFPLVARRFRGFKKREINLLEGKKEMKDFSKTTEYGKEMLIFQEFVEGEVFDCLVIGDNVISIKLSDEGEWNLTAGESNEKYYNISSDLKELAVKTRKAIGAKVCRTKIVGDKIVDMSPNPNLKRFKDISGKNTFERVSKLLKEEK